MKRRLSLNNQPQKRVGDDLTTYESKSIFKSKPIFLPHGQSIHVENEDEVPESNRTVRT
jgi:hypothetical protein